jgi:hypothetical protein
VTATADPIAVIAAARAATAEQIQLAEKAATNQLAALAPLLDRLQQTDAAENKARQEGRAAAAAVAAHDTYDVAPVMVKDVTVNTRLVGGGLIIGAVAAIVAKGFWPNLPDYAAMIIPAITLLAGQILKERGAIIAYRFDGTPSSNAANAINQQIAATVKK